MSKQMEKASENSGFLDGRDYTAAFLYEFFALLVGNGVYANELAPTATNENMSITHGSGHAWINGVCYKNKTPFILTVATADGSLNRYDSLMLRLNLSLNEAYATIVQGAYAAAPTPPEVTRNAEIYDLKICDIYIPAGCTKITQDQITDTRLDAAVCGVPVFPVEHLDLTTFYAQVCTDLENFRQKEQTDFAEWVTTQEESHLATMADLVDIVRQAKNNSVAEIMDLVQQLNDLVSSDDAGELLIEARSKVNRSGDTMTGPLAIAQQANDQNYTLSLGIVSDESKGAGTALKFLNPDSAVVGQLTLWASGSITFSQDGTTHYELRGDHNRNWITKKLAWYNVSPYSDFAPQTISLPVTGVTITGVEIVFLNVASENDAYRLSTGYLPVGNGHKRCAMQSFDYNDAPRCRNFTFITENVIQFDNAYKSTTVDNSGCIPYEIFVTYGVT